jgi:very-short-patch-repair endonuclease
LVNIENKVSLFLRERLRESSMSLNNKKELVEIAKNICRELRKNSTRAERIFWEKVRNKQFYGKKFYRQYPVFHDITGKETFFVADFFCNADKIIIELDGKYHKYRLKEDEERTKILNHLGLRVIRFSNDEIINDVEEVLLKLKKHLAAEMKEIDKVVHNLYGLTEE